MDSPVYQKSRTDFQPWSQRLVKCIPVWKIRDKNLFLSPVWRDHLCSLGSQPKESSWTTISLGFFLPPSPGNISLTKSQIPGIRTRHWGEEEQYSAPIRCHNHSVSRIQIFPILFTIVISLIFQPDWIGRHLGDSYSTLPRVSVRTFLEKIDIWGSNWRRVWAAPSKGLGA